MELTRERPPAEASDRNHADADPRLIETLRAVLQNFAHETHHKPAESEKEKKEKKPEEQIPLFWKLCSAALLSVSAMIVITLYNQLNTIGSQLRSDVGQLRGELGQLRTELVPKDDYNTRIENIVTKLTEVQGTNKSTEKKWNEELASQKSTASDLRQQVKELEKELQFLRLQLAALEQKGLIKPKDKK